MATEIPKERLKKFEAARLLVGAHPSIDIGGCVMEWAAFLAGKPHSDSPTCVSSTIGAFLRPWNDTLPDDKRQMLKPYAPRVLGTRGTPAQEERRSWMAMDWLIREYAPAWLELANLLDDAESLRALPEITNGHGISDVLAVLEPARKRAAAARDAAWDAARDAAWAAARDAAGAAAWDAARDAAGAAAWDAARDAARAAAWDAAWAAARDAAGAALAPTVDRLQQSALRLLDRMIAVTA